MAGQDHMRGWPTTGRGERVCPHGVGHPDPDRRHADDPGVHGCDGCCAPKEES